MDPGTFWHLVVGQHILASHHVPVQDIFSYTFSGHPWVDSQWLIESLMAVIYNISGFDGLLIIYSAILAFLAAWLFRRLKTAGLHFMMAGLILALTFGASTLHFHIRPHLVTIILMAFTFGWLSDFEAKRITRKKLLWLVPLFILWTNSHGGVLGGLATLMLTIAGWSLARLLHWESPINNFGESLFLWGLFLACGLTILLNPYGMELPKTWLAIMNSPVIATRIQEHAPLLKLTGQGSLMVISFGIFYLAALLGTLPQRPRITWFIPLVWFALTLSRVRHAPLFAVTAAVALADIFPQVRWAKLLAARGYETFHIESTPSQSRRLSLTQLVIPVLVVFSLLTFAGLAQNTGALAGHGLVRFDPKHWPMGLLPELQDYAKSHKEGTRIFNDYMMGGFLIFYAPRLRVFIDDRCELYGDKFMLTVFDAPGRTIEDWGKQYGFDLALTQAGSQYNNYLKSAPGWRLVKQTAAGSLYRKLSE